MEYKVYQLDLCLGTYIGSSVDNYYDKLRIIYLKRNGKIGTVLNCDAITLKVKL